MAEVQTNTANVPPNPPPAAPVTSTPSSGPTAAAGAKPQPTPEAAKPTATTAAEPPKAEPPKDERVSAKLQALIAREKKALEAERNAKTVAEQITAREKALDAREARIKEFDSLKETAPLKALELLGLSYDDLTKVRLNDGQVPPDLHVRKVEEKVDSFLKDQEKQRQEATAREKSAAEAREAKAIQDFRSDIASHVETNADKYEFIRFEKQEAKIYEIIDAHYTRTLTEHAEKLKAEGQDPSQAVGKIMTIAEAADKLEEYLEKKYDEARTLKKFQAKISPQPPKPGAKPTNPPPGQKPTTQTLTNTMSATPSRAPTGLLTDEQRYAKAVAYALSLRAQRG